MLNSFSKFSTYKLRSNIEPNNAQYRSFWKKKVEVPKPAINFVTPTNPRKNAKVHKELASTHSVPLSHDFPGTPPTSLGSNSTKMSSSTPKVETRVTVLPNGMKVATEETFSQTSAMMLFVDAGTMYPTCSVVEIALEIPAIVICSIGCYTVAIESKTIHDQLYTFMLDRWIVLEIPSLIKRTWYENDETAGISHIMERMAFKTTTKNQQRELVQELEEMGGNVMSSSSRELMGYSAELLREHVPRMIEIIADTVINPIFDENELNEQKAVIDHELSDIEVTPGSYLPEMFHGVAFKGPLARSMIVPRRALEVITPNELKSWHSMLYKPERMVLGVAGEDHDRVVDLCKKYFNFGNLPAMNIQTEPTIYVGTQHSLPPDPNEKIKPGDKTLSHLIIGWQGASFNSNDMYAMATLHTLLGGGGSFSAGGPGKGMYSRMYRNVLNGNGYVESANTFTSSYRETGLFGIYATVEYAKLNEVLESIMEELLNVAEELGEEEFNRAKNQLKSSIFMALESRAVLADDIARQVLVYGKRHTAEYICEKIDQLTMQDLQHMMKRVLLSPPSMLTYGPGYDKVANINQFVPFFQERFK